MLPLKGAFPCMVSLSISYSAASLQAGMGTAGPGDRWPCIKQQLQRLTKWRPVVGLMDTNPRGHPPELQVHWHEHHASLISHAPHMCADFHDLVSSAGAGGTGGCGGLYKGGKVYFE